MMAEKIRDLLDVANAEIQDARNKRLVAHLKERLREVEAARRVVIKLENQLNKFLDQDTTEAAFDE